MIRGIRPEDAGPLAEIHVFGWRCAYQGIVPDTVLYLDRTVAKGTVFWQRMVTENPAAVLVYDDGLVKGFCLHKPCLDDDALDAWEVQAIYTQPGFTRQGIGSRLMAAAEAGAKAAERTTVKLWVLAQNVSAIQFYHKQGYLPDGAEKQVADWGGVTELRFSKTLAP